VPDRRLRTFLFLAHNCADWDPLSARMSCSRYVIPACRDLNVGRRDSISWVGENHELFFGAMQQATREAIEKYRER